jgi:tRNA pseudouridine38-40 synthase
MRHYRYAILNRKAPAVIEKNRVWHVGGKKLDILAMQKASEYLLGEHDFSAFRDAECQALSPIRTIKNIKIFSDDEEKIFVEVSAKSFLHHMVRNIVGTLVWVGKNKISVDEIKDILEAKDRSKSGPNAPSCGLYFLKTDY